MMRQGKNQIWRSFHVSGWALAAVIVLGAGIARAEDGTPEQRDACKPDVFRLCSEFIPNRTAITACLARNVTKLNPGCRAVFASKR